MGRLTDLIYHGFSEAIDRPGRIQWSIPAFLKIVGAKCERTLLNANPLYILISNKIIGEGRFDVWQKSPSLAPILTSIPRLDQICTALGYESLEDLKRLLFHYATIGILTTQQSSQQGGEGELTLEVTSPVEKIRHKRPCVGKNKAPTAKCKSYRAGRVEGPEPSVTTLEEFEDEEATALLKSPGLVPGPDRSAMQGPQDTSLGRSYDNFGHDTDRRQPE